MNRKDFMRQLEMLLSDITSNERNEAIQFYNDYFDDAGAENEQAVIKALGSPAKVAASIKSDLMGNAVAGEFTETGYKDAFSKKHEMVRYGQPEAEKVNLEKPGPAGQNDRYGGNSYGGQSASGNPYGGQSTGGNPYGGQSASGNPYGGQSTGGNSYGDRSASGNPYGDRSASGNPYGDRSTGSTSYGSQSANGNPYAGSTAYSNNNRNPNDVYQKGNAQSGNAGSSGKAGMSGGMLALIVVLCVFGIPILIPLVMTAVGIAVAVVAVIASLVIAAAAVAFALVITGVILLVVGVSTLFMMPFGGMCLAGGGLACIGAGILFVILTLWLCSAVVPAVVRGIISLCRKLFSKAKGKERI